LSVLDYIPPTGDRKAYRLQVSIGLKEAAELEHLLVAEDLPFQGDMSCLVRTLITFGITQLHKELGTDSYIQSIKHIIGAEILKWSTQYCDSFAVSSVDHLYLALESGDTERAEEVFNQVVEVITSVENKAAHAMLLHHLDKRGFTKTAIKLREAMIQSDINVYHFDNTYAEVFN
jgi:hypothetical protein